MPRKEGRLQLPWKDFSSSVKGLPLKILAIVSTIDLRYKLGCTPSWWQLLKALHETGNEVVLTPYLGDPVESLWWKTYGNPCSRESVLFNSYLIWKRNGGRSPSKRTPFSAVGDGLVNHYVRPRWKRHLQRILSREGDVDAVLFMSVPLNHIKGIPSAIKTEFGIPIAYYDGDMPTILPKYAISRGFRFDYYDGADLTELDIFFTNSKKVVTDLTEMGARKVYPLYYAADPVLFSPVEREKDIDVSFFGYGSELREEWMTKMITVPSTKMPGVRFSVAGGGFRIPLGEAKLVGDLSYSQYRDFSCRSVINLNIARSTHANAYASSSSRPFELAAFGACIVSQPYRGIEEWFEVGKELLVVHSEEEAIETYQWLLSDRGAAREFGIRARDRVLREHTFHHRADEMAQGIRGAHDNVLRTPA